MNRRTFLGTVAAAGSSVLAGCASVFDVQAGYGGEPPLPENRPNAVYYPSHREGMKMVGMNTGGEQSDYACALTYSYPHRFWTVTGDRKSRVSTQNDDSVHLMVSVWDAQTGTYVMDTNPTVTVSQNGDTVTTVTPWTMLSQNMGFHAGDNVALPGGGTYSVTVEVPPTAARRTGAFAGRFDSQQSFEFTFEYSEQNRNDIAYERLGEKAGERGALDPMTMQRLPLARAPKKRALPGEVLGTATSGGGVFVLTAIEDAPRFGTRGTYLAVSPRTPYNRYVLPAMSLSARVVRGGRTVFDSALPATLDPALDYHYGTTVANLRAGDEIELTIDAPPQVARHEGYETTFLDMPSTTITVGR